MGDKVKNQLNIEDKIIILFMGKSRTGAGCSGASLYKCNANLKTGGGNKKQGITSRVGLDNWDNREVQVKSNGIGRTKLISMNQLGGVGPGHSMFGGRWNRSDGVQTINSSTIQSTTTVDTSLQGVDLITSLTDEFLRCVAVIHDSVATAALFCSNGILLGTVSTIIRYGIDIKLYFDYFVNLDELTVLSKTYTISNIPDSDIWINNAYVTFRYRKTTTPPTTPPTYYYVTIVARMQFTYDNTCIYELYSAQLPEENSALITVSGQP